MLSLSVLTAAASLALDVSGLRSGNSAAYELSPGPHVTGNLLTYSGWTINFLLPTVRSFGDAVDPSVFAWGAVALVLAVGGLAPVAALELAGLLTANGVALVQKIERHPFTIEGLRAQAVVDRALISQRAIESLREAAIPPGATIVFWSPTSRALEDLGEEDRWSYGERNVRAALYDGLGVRVFFPGVREVRFTIRFEPEADYASRCAVSSISARRRRAGRPNASSPADTFA